MRVRDEHEVDARPERLRHGHERPDQRTDPVAQDGVGDDAHAVHLDDGRGVAEERHASAARGRHEAKYRPTRPQRGATITSVVDPETIRSAPKVLLHDHLDGGLRPATVMELADASRLRRPAHRGRRGPGALVPLRRRPQVPGALSRGLPTHGGRHADARGHRRAWPPNASRTWPPMASCTPRCATRPSSRPRAASSLDEVMEAWLDGFAAWCTRRGRGRAPHRHPRHRDGDAPVRAIGRDRGALRPLSGPGRRGLRHRRPRGGLPAQPPPGCLPAHPSRQLPRDHPRR